MKIRTKNVLKSIITIIIIAVVSTISGLYVGNTEAKRWIDKNVFKREIVSDNLKVIDLEEESTKVIAYSSKIATFAKNVLTIYDSNGRVMNTIDVEITNATFFAKDNYLLIVDLGSSNIYLVNGTTLSWSKKLEGNISNACVNDIGEVAVILTDTSYKSIITMFDYYGKEEFKTYLSNTLATDVKISSRGEYLRYIESDFSGSLIVNKLKTIDVNSTKDNSEKSLKHSYDFDSDELLLKCEYKKDNLLVFSNKKCYTLKDGEKIEILEIKENIAFVEINLKEQIAFVEENEEGLQLLKMVNINNFTEREYIVDEIVKDIYSNSKMVAINTSGQVYFVKKNGSLKKKFITNSNILDISMGDTVAAIIYKNRVEILKM